MSACFCVGPQNGEPLCPCRMRSVEVRDGRYVQIMDHGPAPTEVQRQVNEAMNEWWQKSKSESEKARDEGLRRSVRRMCDRFDQEIVSMLDRAS